MGNSEVGHMTLGTGRVIKQSLVAIDDLFATGEFQKIPAFQNALEHLEKYGGNLHIMGLFGNGGVHASDHHLRELLKIIPSQYSVYLHLFGDGRDLPPQSALTMMQQFEKELEQYPNVKISSF